jgi:hypothetical protein
LTLKILAEVIYKNDTFLVPIIFAEHSKGSKKKTLYPVMPRPKNLRNLIQN